jgi:predicted amidohydrolase
VQFPVVAGLQLNLVWEDAAANLRCVEEWVARRAPLPGTLVVLPEMVTSGFSFERERVAEPEGGRSECGLSSVAKRHQIWMVAGLAVSAAAGTAANQAVVFGPDGGVVARYRKQRLFAPGGEDLHYRAGSEPVVVDWAGLRVAVFICYDLRFPELFREAARRWRPELYLVIASWPDTRVAHWLKLLQARAIENQAFVLGVNRVGNDPSHRYTGHSVLVNPWGEIVSEAGEVEGWVGGELDLEALRSYRHKLPFLNGISC